MKTKIWHQSFTVLSDVPTYRDALKNRIAKVVSADTEVVMHGQIVGTYPSEYPGTDLKYEYLFELHGLQWIAAALQAEKEGYDGMVLASIPSPMIRQIRSLVSIPVVGYGESAFHLSGLYGRKFGMLFFNIERKDFWLEQTRKWGVSERFAGIAPAGVTFHQVAESLTNVELRKKVIQTIIVNGEKMTQELGADVIVPGELPMNLLLAQEGVNQIGGATVIDGIATCYKMLETLIALRQVSGMKPSERGYFHDRPERARVMEVLKFYGLDNLGERIQVD
jgi:allantoin racemase